VFDPLPGWIIDKHDEVISAGLPSLEYLRQFAYEQAQKAPANLPETETIADIQDKLKISMDIANERLQHLEAANEHSRQLLEAQANEHALIAELRVWNEKLRQENQSLEMANRKIQKDNQNIEQKKQLVEEQLKQIQESLSWKLTTPLRWMRKGWQGKSLNR
jgi:ATP-dependent Lon protease